MAKKDEQLKQPIVWVRLPGRDKSLPASSVEDLGDKQVILWTTKDGVNKKIELYKTGLMVETELNTAIL